KRLPRQIAALATASFALACGRAAPPPNAAAKNSDSGGAPIVAAPDAPAVLFVGTSLTAGYGLDPAAAWTTLVPRKIDSASLACRGSGAGVSGESSADALHRIDWLIAHDPAKVIMVETGANDALRGQSPDSVRANLDAILDRLDALSPRPIVIVAGMEALPNL